MVMLGGGTDILRGVTGLAGGDGAGRLEPARLRPWHEWLAKYERAVNDRWMVG